MIEENTASEREKLPTKSQEYALEIKETLSQIEKEIEPILREPVPHEEKSMPSASSSHLVLALKGIVKQAKSLRDRIDL